MLTKQWIKPVSSQMNLILVCLLIIGAIGVYNWIIAPHQNYIQAAQRYESTTKNLTKKKQMIRNNLNSQKTELKELEEKLNSDLGMLFEPSEAKEFFNSIETVSEKAGCTMYSLTFPQADVQSSKNNPNTNSRIIAKVAKLTILGGYGNITDFMNKLQENSKYVRIDSVKIYSDNNIPDYLRCDMSVTIYIVSGKENHRHEP
jgi:Tfp pilus assembly protein PilO